METPAAEITVDETLVAGLLRAQHPDLADQALRFVASGWDNTIYRLGDAYAVRLPRRSLSAALVEKEQRWMPDLARRLTVRIPSPVRVGLPSAEFPWRWSVTPWLDGEVARYDPSGMLVPDIAGFIRELHTDADADAPRSPVRGVPLADRNGVVLARLREEPIPRWAEVVEQWRAAVAATPWDAPAVWLHGDLHPSNILTRDGRLAAVLDFGDLAAGDPATDLAVAWLLFDHAGRTAFRVALDYDDAAWQRARGWAVIFATLALGGDSDFRRFGEDGIRELLDD
jgi:aminoglycoside phosphotransferase (APT) family kinase protein